MASNKAATDKPENVGIFQSKGRVEQVQNSDLRWEPQPEEAFGVPGRNMVAFQIRRVSSSEVGVGAGGRGGEAFLRSLQSFDFLFLYHTREKIKAQRAISAQVSERKKEEESTLELRSCVCYVGIRGRMVGYSEAWETEAHIVRTVASAQASRAWTLLHSSSTPQGPL